MSNTLQTLWQELKTQYAIPNSAPNDLIKNLVTKVEQDLVQRERRLFNVCLRLRYQEVKSVKVQELSQMREWIEYKSARLEDTQRLIANMRKVYNLLTLEHGLEPFNDSMVRVTESTSATNDGSPPRNKTVSSNTSVTTTNSVLSVTDHSSIVNPTLPGKEIKTPIEIPGSKPITIEENPILPVQALKDLDGATTNKIIEGEKSDDKIETLSAKLTTNSTIQSINSELSNLDNNSKNEDNPKVLGDNPKVLGDNPKVLDNHSKNNNSKIDNNSKVLNDNSKTDNNPTILDNKASTVDEKSKSIDKDTLILKADEMSKTSGESKVSIVLGTPRGSKIEVEPLSTLMPKIDPVTSLFGPSGIAVNTSSLPTMALISSGILIPSSTLPASPILSRSTLIVPEPPVDIGGSSSSNSTVDPQPSLLAKGSLNSSGGEGLSKGLIGPVLPSSELSKNSPPTTIPEILNLKALPTVLPAAPKLPPVPDH